MFSGGNVASVQFLRFIAATLVVFVHAALALSDHIPGSVSNLFLRNAHFGASGVHIFFVISGFIMVYTSFNRDPDGKFSPSAFLFRRFIRIYPIYLVYCVFYLIFYHSYMGTPLPSTKGIIGSMVLLPGYSSRIIGPGWTLAYEVYFYLCFSVAMMLGLRRGMLTLTVFFLISIASHFAIGMSSPALFVLTNSLLLEFLFGAWIAYAVISQVPLGNFAAKAAVALGVVAFLAGMVFGYDRLPSVLTWGIPSALLIGGSVFCERNGHLPNFVGKWSFLGDSSYSLYLLHVLLIDVIVLVLLRDNFWILRIIGEVGPVGIIALCCALMLYSIVVALFAYELIERRLLGRLRNFYRGATAPMGKHQEVH